MDASGSADCTMHLELDGAGPLYLQLTRALKTAIQAGRLLPEARMPSTRALAEALDLSRNTVKSAFEQLAAEGWVRGVAGSGSFVMPGAGQASARSLAHAAIAPQSAYAARLRSGVQDIPFPAAARFNLQYGAPLHDPLAIDAWRKELAYAASHTPIGYPPLQGLPVLREAIADYLRRRRGLSCSAADILIVNGTQQALALAARVLLDPQDCVVLEEPPYFGARHVFATHGCQLLAVPADADGLVTDALPAQAPKLVYVTPAHQFPGGGLMSPARRSALLAYAARQQCWIMEDDYDSEFRYDSRPLPALKAGDAAGRVIYVGSFSKVFSPAVRLGYMVLPPALRRDFVGARYLMDLGGASIEQAAMARYMASGAFERHLRRTVQATRLRRQRLLAGLAAHAHGWFDIDDSGAGMHVVAWLRGASHKQCEAFIAAAAARGLGLHPIAPHYMRRPRGAGLLLGFASLTPAEIDAAMLLLGRCLAAALKAGVLRRPPA
jgi:GntR family transcriptional regulator/MocR family aminotransferase